MISSTDASYRMQIKDDGDWPTCNMHSEEYIHDGKYNVANNLRARIFYVCMSRENII
jgi:hypothetical protein